MRLYLAPTDRKLTTRLLLVLLAAAFAHNLFHEFGHWLVGALLGNPMSMNLNLAWPTSGHYREDWQAVASSLGGPGCSILMAAAAWIVVEKFGTVYAYPFLFFPLYCRTFSLLLGGFAKQDEAFISARLGLGQYTVALIVCVILLGLVWRGSRRLKLDPQAIGNWCVAGTGAQLLVIATQKIIHRPSLLPPR
ncbi:hypothetical protein ESB00_05505 [Oleiharenicola lentus]|jgi:hypothetical protein|uniref:M50 family peptidase n=1 Tax=Oleiharenicola lentus TaxID=2508720 RepID=A0A4Q1C8S6_9BACT|nr:hypothetical protein [Oleiharenicola lentus]RXK55354.1 hypothetical protein ESB00_05505 [Oleiharenicola lentus]